MEPFACPPLRIPRTKRLCARKGEYAVKETDATIAFLAAFARSAGNRGVLQSVSIEDEAVVEQQAAVHVAGSDGTAGCRSSRVCWCTNAAAAGGPFSCCHPRRRFSAVRIYGTGRAGGVFRCSWRSRLVLSSSRSVNSTPCLNLNPDRVLVRYRTRTETHQQSPEPSASEPRASRARCASTPRYRTVRGLQQGYDTAVSYSYRTLVHPDTFPASRTRHDVGHGQIDAVHNR